MSISAVAFWSSDYASAIFGTKEMFSNRVYGEKNDKTAQQADFLGIKQRKDEYIPSNRADKKSNKTEQYSEEERKAIDKLRQRDQEVRAHEQAHIAAGGAYVRGGASYSYQSGPDGKQYAVGGEVSIDTSVVKDNPEATIAKMQAVRGAALAPASPSGQDIAVAAAASQAEAQARVELRERQSQEKEETQQKTQENSNKMMDTAISAYTDFFNKQTNISQINLAA